MLSGPRRASERTSRGGDSRWPRPRPARHAGKRAGPAPPLGHVVRPAAARAARILGELSQLIPLRARRVPGPPHRPSLGPTSLPARAFGAASGGRAEPRRASSQPFMAASPDRACGRNAGARSPLHVYRGRQSSSRPSRGQRLCTARASVSVTRLCPPAGSGVEKPPGNREVTVGARARVARLHPQQGACNP